MRIINHTWWCLPDIFQQAKRNSQTNVTKVTNAKNIQEVWDNNDKRDINNNINNNNNNQWRSDLKIKRIYAFLNTSGGCAMQL